MTILKPSATKNLRSFILFMIFVTVAGGLIYIREYNSFVNIRHELGRLKSDLVALQAANADLKNEFYLAIESKKLEELARREGLVFEKRPEYLSLGQWLSDSSH